ncbi:unnamed protein product, partial [Symbiodinium pilosum]
ATAFAEANTSRKKGDWSFEAIATKVDARLRDWGVDPASCQRAESADEPASPEPSVGMSEPAGPDVSQGVDAAPPEPAHEEPAASKSVVGALLLPSVTRAPRARGGRGARAKPKATAAQK